MLKQRTDVFAALGRTFHALASGRCPDRGLAAQFEESVARALVDNAWFTRENILSAIEAIAAGMLDREVLERWLSKYDFTGVKPRRVAVIAAGNIPLVGFADLLCVLVCGHRLLLKPSSKDRALMVFAAGLLQERFDVEIADAIPDHFDALIATGSDNSNRYFTEVAADKPALLRHNRFSIAVLTGGETDDELRLLANDVFDYFGLGCRSVSRIFVPAGMPVERLLEIMRGYAITHESYLNRYRYNKAVFGMEGVPFYDGGFFVATESNVCEAGDQPVLGQVQLVRYASGREIMQWVGRYGESLQCLVAGPVLGFSGAIPFGTAQRPGPENYPDGRDVICFLLSL